MHTPCNTPSNLLISTLRSASAASSLRSLLRSLLPLASCLFSLSLLPLSSLSAEPDLRWDVETSRNQPVGLEIRRGETLTLTPRFLSYGSALTLSNETVSLIYRNADLGAGLYYAITGSVHSATGGQVRVRWTTNSCPAATNYTYDFWVSKGSTNILRAYGTLKLLDSVYNNATATTNISAWRYLDWSLITNLNLSSGPWQAGDLAGSQNVAAATAALSNYVAAVALLNTNAWQAGDLAGSQNVAAATAALSNYVAAVALLNTNAWQAGDLAGSQNVAAATAALSNYVAAVALLNTNAWQAGDLAGSQNVASATAALSNYVAAVAQQTTNDICGTVIPASSVAYATGATNGFTITGEAGLLIGDSLDAVETKQLRIRSPAYRTNTPPVAVLKADSDETQTFLNIGGGDPAAQAPTWIRFSTAGNTNTLTGTERMRIDPNGQVGIGTNTPAVMLDVNGATTVRGAFMANGGGNVVTNGMKIGASTNADSAASADFATDAGTLDTMDSAAFFWLDQATPQTIINGIPIFSLGVSAGGSSEVTNLQVNGSHTVLGELFAYGGGNVTTNNASQIDSGTLADARIASTIARDSEVWAGDLAGSQYVAQVVSTNVAADSAKLGGVAADRYITNLAAGVVDGWHAASNILSYSVSTVTITRAMGEYIAWSLTNNATLCIDRSTFPSNGAAFVQVSLYIGAYSLTFCTNSISTNAATGNPPGSGGVTLTNNAWNSVILHNPYGNSNALWGIRQ